jgi:hypothetical protein
LNLRLKSEGLGINSRESCAIHYRLGDLLTLNEKNPISRERIVLEYQKLEALWNFERLIVFSDSPEKAFQLFEGVTALEFIAPDYSTLEVMALSINAKFFVGTSSKISFWISGVRSQVRLEPSLLPSNNLLQYRGLVGIEMKGISTYQPNA